MMLKKTIQKITLLSGVCKKLQVLLVIIANALPGFAIDDSKMIVLFLGDSLTAGYGINKDRAYPSLIKKKTNASGMNVRIINAGISGDTTAGGLRRLSWYFKQDFDVLLIALGANDGLRGLDPASSKTNIQAMIDLTKTRKPNVKIIIAGMQVPPNMGPGYANAFRAIFPELAMKNTSRLIPFLLEGVGGVKELNLPDGIHPTEKGHMIVCENVWKVLGPVLEGMKHLRTE